MELLYHLSYNGKKNEKLVHSTLSGTICQYLVNESLEANIAKDLPLACEMD
jgi:hypothetical protein